MVAGCSLIIDEEYAFEPAVGAPDAAPAQVGAGGARSGAPGGEAGGEAGAGASGAGHGGALGSLSNDAGDLAPSESSMCAPGAADGGELEDGLGCAFPICSDGEPSLAFRPPGTPCGDPVATSCSNADFCDGLGNCSSNHLSSGALVASPAGDCRASRCDGNGGLEDIADDSDVPADPGGGCQRPACSEGSVTTGPRLAGTPCGAGETACSQADECDGAGACLPRHRPSGFVLSAATADDCRARRCDGSGGVVETPTDAVCPGLRGPGTGRCTGAGNCIECNDATVATDCGGPDTGCSGGSCRVTCNCSEEACNRTYSVLCGRL